MIKDAAMKVLLLLLCLCPIHAQDIEYGKPSELKGITKVFIDTNGDIKNRERIIKEIEKAKLNLTLLDSAEGAEIIIEFIGDKRDIYAKGSGRPINVGKGMVFIPKGNKIRALLSFEGQERKIWDDKPATNLGKMFVKEYKRANGIK